MKPLLLLFLLAGTVLLAEDPRDLGLWTTVKLKDIAANLKIDPSTSDGSTALANYANHVLLEVRRDGDGDVHMNENRFEIWFVTSGTADIILGGTVVGGRITKAGNIQGKSINGGVTKKMATGDVILIPANTPHQVLTHGKSFTYFEVIGESK